jgi:hypothetical protein
MPEEPKVPARVRVLAVCLKGEKGEMVSNHLHEDRRK